MNLKEYIEKFYKGTKNEFVELLEKRIDNNEKTFIITANPETVMTARREEQLEKYYFDDNSLVVPDGIGIIKAGKILNIEFKETIPGIELCLDLLNLLNSKHKSIYLFGASDEVVEALSKTINENYPNINVLGFSNGYIENKDLEMEKIAKLKPDVILVALGVPQQEILIGNHLKDFEKGIFMGVGGSFDVLSGKKKRAPKFFINTHTEWLYRIVREPKRLKRFWNNNIKFLKEIKKEKRNGEVND